MEAPFVQPDEAGDGPSNGGGTATEDPAPEPGLDGGSVDPGTVDAGSPDAGTVDAGPLPEAPPPLDPECAAMPPVMPEAPAQWREHSRSGDKYMQCGPSASDGVGSVVFSHFSTDQSYAMNLHMWFWGEGSPASLESRGVFLPTDRFLAFGQPRGFLNFNSAYHDSVTYLDSRTGEVTHHPLDQDGYFVSAAADPNGGARGLLDDGTLKAYGPTGELLWSASTPMRGYVRAMGVDARGNTLIIVAEGYDVGGTTQAQGLWVDASGQPGNPFLALAQAPIGWFAFYELVPQATEGLFLGTSNRDTPKTWTAFAPLEPQGRPGPAWLQSDPAETVTLSRLESGKGYIRWRRTSACQNAAEFLTPSGKSCGTTRFPPLYPEAPNFCGTLSRGPDGTVIETFPVVSERPPESDVSIKTCAYRWWPALLP
ncbi:hypothetical protein [Corallococcus sp. AS-1-6]|uniref:hypothetical protein n=1 Tax=Corallococcus sp. AS-1-6 TaxID=2874599 RepID=UPI001CBF3BA9|nr:hypothetical protein [Corallococcus sp. AS-1-6]MBZ4375623.1 hypothetical protein [Corallococcus sp. AS-1-6]